MLLDGQNSGGLNATLLNATLRKQLQVVLHDIEGLGQWPAGGYDL